MLIFQFKSPQEKPKEQLVVSNLSFNRNSWTLSMNIGGKDMAFNLWGLKQAAGSQSAGQQVTGMVGRFVRSVEKGAREYCRGDMRQFAQMMRYSVELFLKGQTTGQNPVRSSSNLARELLKNPKAADQAGQFAKMQGQTGLEALGTLYSPEFLKAVTTEVTNHYDYKTGSHNRILKEGKDCSCGVKEGETVIDASKAAQLRDQLASKLLSSTAVQDKLVFVTGETEKDILKAIREQGTVRPMIAAWEGQERGFAKAVPRLAR